MVIWILSLSSDPLRHCGPYLEASLGSSSVPKVPVNLTGSWEENQNINKKWITDPQKKRVQTHSISLGNLPKSNVSEVVDRLWFVVLVPHGHLGQSFKHSKVTQGHSGSRHFIVSLRDDNSSWMCRLGAGLFIWGGCLLISCCQFQLLFFVQPLLGWVNMV